MSGTKVSIDSSTTEPAPLYANTGLGWADTRWLRKASYSSYPVAECLRSYPVRYSQAFVEANSNAMLSLISTTEGTGSCYNFMVGFKKFYTYAKHPNIEQPFGEKTSTAAGRYQFLFSTWQEMVNAKGYIDFSPVNQDGATLHYMGVRGFTTPGKTLNRADFERAMDRLSYAWASLPPGRHGQPAYTMDEAWGIYQDFRNQ